MREREADRKTDIQTETDREKKKERKGGEKERKRKRQREKMYYSQTHCISSQKQGQTGFPHMWTAKTLSGVPYSTTLKPTVYSESNARADASETPFNPALAPNTLHTR